MNIEDCIPLMSTAYLKRIVDSFLKDDVPRGDENRLREMIRQNQAEIHSKKRIADVFRLDQMSRSTRILTDGVISSLISTADMSASEEALFDMVKDFEQGIVEQAKSLEAFKFSDQRNLEIYETVLAVALEDDQVSVDEFRMLEKLRTKLGISRREHRLIEAKIDKFPRVGNKIHGFEEFREAVRRLQANGILFYCNRADGGPLIVLPEEVAPIIKALLGIELRPAAQRLMQEALSGDQLHGVLKGQNLPTSGTKAERSERLLSAGCKPSEVLGFLKNDELGELCRKLRGVQVSGLKADRIERIISYYDSLTVKPSTISEDSRAVWYQYLEELAARDNQNLYSQGLIKHDREMESGFEEGTRFLFEEKLGCSLIPMSGTDHADGCVTFPNGEYLLWDNKGKESVYHFPKAHMDQFHRYIRESAIRVNVFLVVVPEIGDGVAAATMKLKHSCTTDTDVAVVTAENIKWVAENWKRFSKSGEFSLQVFNMTGVLDRATLEMRMEVLLK